MKVKSESKVAQSCPTLGDPMDCSPPGSSAHEIFQARVLEWGAISRIVKSIVKESRLIIIRVWLEAGKGAIVHEHRKGYNCSCFIR